MTNPLPTMQTAPPAPATPTPTPTPKLVQSPAPVPASLLADPISGGNYIRDPITGQLSRNPAHAVQPTTNPTPQE